MWKQEKTEKEVGDDVETRIIIDDKALMLSLDEQMARLRNLRPVMRVIAQDLMTQKDINFRKQSEPDGKKWALLSIDSTLKRRNNDVATIKVLQDTGRLRASFKSKTTNNSAKIGTNVKYAKTHQFGARKGQYRVRLQGTSLRNRRRWTITIPWGDIPARPMVGLTRRMRNKYNKKVTDYILEGVL